MPYYRSASGVCYDGSEYDSKTRTTSKISTTCRYRQDFWEEAAKFCAGKCNEDGSKCGVNNFGVGDYC